MLKKVRLLTRPTLAVISPSHPESAKTDSSPRDAPCPKQGRSERGAEEVQTALRVGRSPLEWILANGKAPSSASDIRETPLNVEPLSDARTKLADFSASCWPYRKGGELRMEEENASRCQSTELSVACLVNQRPFLVRLETAHHEAEMF